MRISQQEYLDALEEERRKIEVFHRELPLCLDLVNQAIERCRRQLSCEVEDEYEEEETSSGEGPVLEEFIPLKRITTGSRTGATSSISECEHQSVDRSGESKLGTKVDWLRSVQLWTNSHINQTSEEDHSPRKSSVNIEAKKNGSSGAFHPFRKEKSESPATTTATTTTTATATTTTTTAVVAAATRPAVPTAAASSTADNGGSKSGEDRQKGQANKKARRCWSPELHRRFLQALQQLGGSHAATPKQIRELMKVDGLTNDEVKSHLQKYRLHTRRSPGPQHQNTTTSQPPQFVVVGGIWVPPPEYTTVTTCKGEALPPSCSKGIYVPVATPPQLTLSPCSTQPQQKKQLHRPQPIGLSHSDERSSRAEHSIGHGGGISECRSGSQSPTTTCSSMDTTTASPAF